MRVCRQMVALCVLLPLLSCAASEPGADPSDLPRTASSSPAEPDAAVRLLLTFDQPPAEGTERAFDAGGGWPEAVVVESQPGVLQIVDGAEASARAVQFPPSCPEVEDCARAFVEIPDDDRLDPGTENFQFGALVRVAPDQVGAGSNIVQKGRFDTPGGQWKLQVDGGKGRPSCVLQGQVDGAREMVRLVANLGIADGQWHRVGCARRDGSLTITVDETAKTIDAEVGDVRNGAGVRIGASGSAPTDDQFHGVIDEVDFCLPGCE